MLQKPLLRAALAVALICLPCLPLRAQEVSAWAREDHAAARLVSGAALQAETSVQLRAGIEIRLDRGWKTFWRYPGDSGVPPTVDFARSDNVQSVTLLWPAPERFADGAGGYSIGYHGDVILPLQITAKEAAKPSTLRVKLRYAICGNVCVPAEADLGLVLSKQAGAEEAALSAAEARVPRRLPLGAGNGLAISSVHRQHADGRERVVVDVNAPKGVAVDLFVEGPSPDWTLPLPEPTGSAPSAGSATRRFIFDLDGLPPGAQAAGAALTLTAVSPLDAVEVTTDLD